MGFFHSSPATEAGNGSKRHTETKQDDEFLVRWEDNDPHNPRHWPLSRRLYVTFQLGMLAFASSIGSSITSPATSIIRDEIYVSDEVAILPISLYVLGFALGPLIWAPIAELWGRKWSMVPAMFCLSLFSLGTARSNTASAIFVTRFFAGVFGSAPVSNVSAALSDLWAPAARGYAVVYYSIAVVGGPTIGPLIGAAIIVNPHLSWRWTEYITAIWSFTAFIFAWVTMPESYPPVLLARKAAALRKSSGDHRYFHPHESKNISLDEIVNKYFARPMRMLLTEPVVICVALYASFVYGILYLTVAAFPYVFAETRHMSPVPASATSLAIFVGVLAAIPINLFNQPRYARLSAEAGGKPVPDARLLPICVAGFLFTGGLFWFGWTAAPEFSVWLPTAGAVLIGAGFNTIFNQCMNVLVDTYGVWATSAVAANTFLRSVLAAAFPIIVKPMFDKLKISGAVSLLGAISAAMILVPFLLMKYGETLRRRSRMIPK